MVEPIWSDREWADRPDVGQIFTAPASLPILTCMGSIDRLGECMGADSSEWHDREVLAGLAGAESPDVLVVVDPDGVMRYTSDAAERMLGYEPSSSIGSAIWEFVHPDDMITAGGALQEASRTEGYHVPTALRVRHASDGWIRCEVNGVTLDGPGGAWVVLSLRAEADRDETMDRRVRIEHLIRLASLECSAVRWNDVDPLVERFLQDLSTIVGAESAELAWQESDEPLRVGARWPVVRTGPVVMQGGTEFTPLWPFDESSVELLHFSADLASLEPSDVRDRFLRLRTQAVVEVPLTPRRPWAVLRLAFGPTWHRWDDANVDLVVVLASTLMATLRRCLAEEHLHQQARTDPLTGLMNRAELYRRFEELLARHEATDDELGVLYCDLDLFKQVNDRFGHAAGDELLRQVADELRTNVRDVDLVARFGGDEFVIVCPQLESSETLERIMGRVCNAVRRLAPHGVAVRLSVGAAMAQPGFGVDELIRLSDEAMYRAKRGSRVAVPVV